jgi:dimethylglycine dehydrogenase
MPREVGRSCLTPLIGKRGGVAGDFTVTRLGPEEFWVSAAGMAERFHQRFFRAVPLPEGTTFESLTEASAASTWPGRARATCSCAADQCGPVERGLPVLPLAADHRGGRRLVAIRVSFTGDLGWELHCAEADQVRSTPRCWRPGAPWARARWAAGR